MIFWHKDTTLCLWKWSTQAHVSQASKSWRWNWLHTSSVCREKSHMIVTGLLWMVSAMCDEEGDDGLTHFD
jgi:hypothetical protein